MVCSSSVLELFAASLYNNVWKHTRIIYRNVLKTKHNCSLKHEMPGLELYASEFQQSLKTFKIYIAVLATLLQDFLFLMTLLINKYKVSNTWHFWLTPWELPADWWEWEFDHTIEPITECVRKNSLIYRFLIHCYQTCFMIGLTNDQIMILTNHNYLVLDGQ